MAAADQELVGLDMQFGGRQCNRGRSCFQNLQVLAAEFCVGSRPGLKAADAVEDVGGGAGKVYEAVFFF